MLRVIVHASIGKPSGEFHRRTKRDYRMKGIPTPGQALDPGGFASFPAPRGEV